MESLILAIQVVFPLCAILVVGYIMKRTLKLTLESTNQMNTSVFRCFLPVLLFKNVYTSDLKQDFDPMIVLYALACIGIIYIILCLTIPKIESDRRKCSVMIQGIYRSNYVLYGIPIVESIFGSDRLGMASVMAAIVIPFINVLSVLVFELFRGTKMNWGRTVKGVLTNPLVLASAAGLLFMGLKIKLPEPVMVTINYLSNVATPLALFALGAEFHFKSIRKYWKQLLISVTGRLLCVPIICLSIAILLGVRGMALVVLMAVFASPTAVASYSMACAMDGDAELAGQILVLTTVFSIVTIFCYTFLFNFMGLIYV